VTRSFEDLVKTELPGLLRFATALCGDPDQGRDLVQEVLVRAFERWDRIADVSRPGAYLMRMTTNEFLSWRRRWYTRSVDSAAVDALDRVAEPDRDHADDVAIRDDLEWRLARLPRRQRAALVLRFYLDLDYPEAAQVLGCAEGSVRSACSRGLAALRLDDQRSPLLPRLDAL
jgi:RNA polymerase sigma-70 factor (sigma-E family)